MTDFTTDAPIVRSRASGDSVRHRTTPPKREYYAYFAIIFAATLPLAILTWALKAARQMALPEKGPIAKAWSQARIITPQIFSA